MSLLPQLFTVTEPASIRILTGDVPREIPDIYPALESINLQVSRKAAGAGTIVLSAGRDETGAWPVVDGGYFERWTPIRVQADFGPYQEDVLWGYVVKMTPEFPQDRGAAKLTVEVQDQTIALDRAEVTRTWGDETSGSAITDRAIVASIALDYGLTLDALSGDGQSRVTVNQDKSDLRFLNELAEAVGYEFRILFGEIYFGPLRLEGESQPQILVYAGPDTNCLEFSLEEEAATPDEAVSAAMDAEGSGTAVETRFTPNLPILGRRAATSEAPGTPAFAWRLKQEGDNAPAAADALAQAKINEASLSISAECTIDGTLYGHVLLPGALVTVDGIGERYGGRFYVDAVEHEFDANGYRQKAILLKNGVDEG